ncbi:hypothetical protein [Streptomyces sp. NPDC051286]
MDISDENRWFTVLAFRSHLPGAAEQADRATSEAELSWLATTLKDLETR